MATNRRTAYGGKMHPGRPRKDEIVAKPFIVHKRHKPENELKYAEEAIRNAQNIYRMYAKGYPNPLNIEVKDLCPEAREIWKALFGMRGYVDEDVKLQSGVLKVFNEPEEVVLAFEAYVRYIKDHNFVKEFERPDGTIGVIPIIPNQSNFARWMGVTAMSISNWIRKDESCMEKYRLLLADCLSEGGMVGIYQPSTTIFALKNMCDWSDKYEDRNNGKKEVIDIAEAEELMKKLGYTREKATLDAPKPVLEAGDE